MNKVFLCSAACLLTMAGAAAQLQPIPDKLVVLTFDDSKASHYTVVRPLLKKYGFGATFFISEGFSFRTNKEDYLTWEQIAELHRDGFEIGNHTRDHKGVTKANLAGLREQVEAINAQCAAHGVPAPVSFAYPGMPSSQPASRCWRNLAFGLPVAEGLRNIRTRTATAWPMSQGATIHFCFRRQAMRVHSGLWKT